MPVLPKQADDTDVEHGGVWNASPWNCDTAGGPQTGGSLLSSEDVAYCCLPTGCPHYLTDPICLSDLGDAVKVITDIIANYNLRGIE